MKRVIPPSLIAVLFCVCALGATAQTVITNIVMVPRLTIESDISSTNQIQYSTDLTNWVVLTNLLVVQRPYWFVDVGAPPAPHRFYRVVTSYPAPTPTNMALIPAGAFQMGDSFSEGEYELPVHTVYVSAFYMDQTEVTTALWDEVKNWAVTHGYSFSYGLGKAASHPVGNVSWYDAVKWCNARSEKEARGEASHITKPRRIP